MKYEYELGFKQVSADPEAWRKSTEDEKNREREILSKILDDFVPRMPLEASRKAAGALFSVEGSQTAEE